MVDCQMEGTGTKARRDEAIPARRDRLRDEGADPVCNWLSTGFVFSGAFFRKSLCGKLLRHFPSASFGNGAFSHASRFAYQGARTGRDSPYPNNFAGARWKDPKERSRGRELLLPIEDYGTIRHCITEKSPKSTSPSALKSNASQPTA